MSYNKKYSAKSSSRKKPVNSTTSKQNITINTMNNTNNKLVSVEDNLINNSIIESDVGAETKNNISNRLVSCNDVGVDKDTKKTKQKLKNNISNKVVSSNDDGVVKDQKKKSKTEK